MAKDPPNNTAAVPSCSKGLTSTEPTGNEVRPSAMAVNHNTRTKNVEDEDNGEEKPRDDDVDAEVYESSIMTTMTMTKPLARPSSSRNTNSVVSIDGQEQHQPLTSQHSENSDSGHLEQHERERRLRRRTAVSVSDGHGAFRICTYSEDGIFGNDETLILHDAENSLVTQSNVPPANDSTNDVLSAEDQLPVAQTLENDALEREVLDRVLSRQQVVQGEKLSPPSQSKIRRWVPFTFGLGVISVLLVTLAGTGILFPNRREDRDQPSPLDITPPTIAEDTATSVDTQPVLRWLEPILTNRSYSTPTDPTSAQYRAIEWLAEYHPPTNVATKENMGMWLQYYVLVTLYYLAGGETGKWSNDRLWLSTEPLCDWSFILCSDSRFDGDDAYEENGNDKQASPENDIFMIGLDAGTQTL
jgi:hypothetical protein